MRFARLWALGALCVVSGAQAALPPALEQFLSGLGTYRADFEQRVQDAQGKLASSGHGSFWVERPGHFRWDYHSGAAAAGAASADDGQLLVADGKNLWLYERDLAQATVRDIASAESSAPMLLLSGEAAQIEAAFTVTAEAARDGLQWVEVKPRAAGADFARAELSFRGGTLAAMIISDKLGQVSNLQITKSQRNPRLDAALFRFVPPAGVDVIGTVRP